jgi:16S rRNA processing protein RimM
MPPQDVRDGFVAVGRVLGAFGVRGDLKVEPLAPPEVFKQGRTVHLDEKPRAIERSRRHHKILHLKLAGIDNREQAAEMRGLYLEVPEAELPPPGEDTYYWYQLIGLRVVTTAGEELGQIAEIISTAGNDVFVVRGPRGELLIPGIEDVVQEVDIAAGRMVIEPVPGLLD